MAEKYYETGHLCFADPVLSDSNDAFISLNKKFSLLNCNKFMSTEELKKIYLLEGLKPLCKTFETLTAATPEVVDVRLNYLKFALDNRETFVLNYPDIYKKVNSEYFETHIGGVSPNPDASMFNNRDIDAGSRLSTGAYVQFKQATLFHALSGINNFGRSYPLEKGWKVDFCFGNLYVDAKLGRQEIISSSFGTYELIHSVWDLFGDPVPKVSNLPNIIANSAVPKSKANSLIFENRILIVSYDLAIRKLESLDELNDFQQYINKVVLPILKRDNSDFSFPKQLYFGFVGNIKGLSKTEIKNLIKFNCQILIDNNMSYELPIEDFVSSLNLKKNRFMDYFVLTSKRYLKD